MKLELGKVYRDSVHGWEGIATSRTEFLTGCDRVCLERMQDGEIKESYFDVTRIEGVELPPEQKKPGGPGRAVPKPKVMSR